MGRTTKGRDDVAEQGEMFSHLAMGTKKEATVALGGRADVTTLRPPDQTNAKSKLIANYISKFQLVTKGGLYIDGFAAPQSRNHEEAWTARRVLEIKPPRLRCFWLCDMEAKGLTQLQRLKQQHDRRPKSRAVFVMPGDFNQTVRHILYSPKMKRRTAIFALLDQRNTECHWSTVKALASRAGNTKIELLYFLGVSWLHRSLSQSQRPERIEEIDLWWGGNGWTALKDLDQTTIAKVVADRFVKELGYRHVKPYPIYQREDGQRVSFYLIHASDHPEAPKLMDRSYLEIVGDTPDVDLGRQRVMGFDPSGPL